jgi:hypothetical protein
MGGGKEVRQEAVITPKVPGPSIPLLRQADRNVSLFTDKGLGSFWTADLSQSYSILTSGRRMFLRAILAAMMFDSEGLWQVLGAYRVVSCPFAGFPLQAASMV